MTSPNSWHLSASVLLISLPLLLVTVILLSPSQFPAILLPSDPPRSEIWSARRIVEWRPCDWWKDRPITALPERSNGYIRVDCFGGLNQIQRDLCDGIENACLLSATLVLPKFEVAVYWNELSRFEDVLDVEFFIQQTKCFIGVVRCSQPERNNSYVCAIALVASTGCGTSCVMGLGLGLHAC